MISRRQILASAAALILPRSARAQSLLPVMAVLEPGPQLGVGAQAFMVRMKTLGWNDGQTIRIEARYANWDNERLPALARDLVLASPRVIFTHSIPALRAAQAATASVPIIGLSADMVAEGLVASLSAPGGNITGVTTIQRALDAKRLEILHEVVPGAERFGYLVPKSIPSEHVAVVERAARARNISLVVVAVAGVDEIENAIDRLASARVGGFIVQNSALLSREAGRIADGALRHRLPVISESPLFGQSGGLLQYGADIPAMFEQVAVLADKILRGARPAELPIEQPTRFQLIVNLRTAQKIGIAVPQSLLLRADSVIE